MREAEKWPERAVEVEEAAEDRWRRGILAVAVFWSGVFGSGFGF